MKGDWGKLNYRMVFSYPKIIEKEDPISTFASFKNGNPRFQTSGYVKYQFLDKDNGKSAFMPGTFLGTKKVITLGVGFLHQQEATWSLSNLDTLQHDILEFAIDLFVDIPLSYPVRTAITFYGGYFHTDFGPNYLRNIGVNNPANGNDGSTVNGTGNAYPAIGTGKVCYTQLGYYIALTKPLLMIEAVQPYFNLQYADYEKLDQNMILIESGLSLLFNGHQSKLTLGIQNRPIYIRTPADQLKVGNRKNMWVIQYQFKLK